MITYVTGDIFKSKAQVITNTVNCVGVMGKGLAYEFKKRYPEMFEDYKKRCEAQEVLPGKPYLWENENVQVLNFPTKRHWREDTRLSDIDDALKFLAENYAQMGITTLALPPLGCGLGGLDWSEVKVLIEKYLGSIIDLEVFVYEPQGEAKRLDDESVIGRSRSAYRSDDGVAAQQELF